MFIFFKFCAIFEQKNTLYKYKVRSGRSNYMNPRLVKFAVELQSSGKIEKQEKTINFKQKFFNIFKPAKVTVPINKSN